MRGSSSDVRASYGSLPKGSLGIGSSAAAVDRLSAGFSRLQGPSSVPSAGPLTKNGVSVPYSVSQSALAQRYVGRTGACVRWRAMGHPSCLVKTCWMSN